MAVSRLLQEASCRKGRISSPSSIFDQPHLGVYPSALLTNIPFSPRVEAALDDVRPLEKWEQLLHLNGCGPFSPWGFSVKDILDICLYQKAYGKAWKTLYCQRSSFATGVEMVDITNAALPLHRRPHLMKNVCRVKVREPGCCKRFLPLCLLCNANPSVPATPPLVTSLTGMVIPSACFISSYSVHVNHVAFT